MVYVIPFKPPVSGAPRTFGPLDHYDYSALDEFCQCELCTEWRVRFSALIEAQKRVQDRVATCDLKDCHIDMKGKCEDCKAGIKLRTSYLASLNRRDLYSECSFHADSMALPGQSNIVGQAFMNWITNVLNDREQRGDGWWIAKAPFFPMQYWLTMFRRSVSLDSDNLDDEMFTEAEVMPRGTLSTLVSGLVAVAAASGV